MPCSMTSHSITGSNGSCQPAYNSHDMMLSVVLFTRKETMQLLFPVFVLAIKVIQILYNEHQTSNTISPSNLQSFQL